MEAIVVGIFLVVYVMAFIYFIRVPFLKPKQEVMKVINSQISGAISLVRVGGKETWLKMFDVTQGIDARTFINKKSYWHKVAEIIVGHIREHKHAAVLYFGLGGGTIPYLVAHEHEGVVQTVVEIDPTLIEVVKRDFGLVDQESIRMIPADAYALAEAKHSFGQYFDVVMIDIFSDEDSLLTPKSTEDNFVDYVRTLLKRDGILVFNHPAHTKQAEEGVARLVAQLEGRGWKVEKESIYDRKRSFRNVVLRVVV